MDSELQKAIDITERSQFEQVDVREFSQALNTVNKAARKYANLHESIDLDRLSDGLKFGHITDSDGDYLRYVATQVQLALGVTEDE